MLVTNIKDVNYDSYLEKARAILIDKDNFIYTSVINESIQLPGGTVENGEDYHLTIIRELKEEVGLEIDSIDEVGELNFYHTDFPSFRTEGLSNRLNKLHLFFKDITDIPFGDRLLTEYEKSSNMEIIKYKLEDLEKELEKSSDNPYKTFMAEEVKEAIELARKKGLL